ncbi:MAG: hypothetical protein DIZ80_13540 [endosymbiont of Galathealinum brachiosum]|uniref:Uncharacterized protein n=1 Tax=endosymbiont of Galathealinum brachiosum TaxID=2200906 RepID=A0A370D9U8_9GAMM|nr:MAG: hypothetical protein DIZ80_13540 [endosymbiont of Galathealinum brachiosum]
MHKNNSLKKLLNLYQSDDTIAALSTQLNDTDNAKELINLYNQAIPLIEKNLWKNEIAETELRDYQNLFHDLENIISSDKTPDTRYNFIIAIPVADRPQHLKSCLNSIFELCTKYNYGGFENGLFKKISVLIADDSQNTENIIKNREMAEHFTHSGLEVIYFGLEQQKEIVSQLDNRKTKNITGDFTSDNFFHKGASITRNITYLKLQQLQNRNEPTLFYFIDSDQEFQVSIQTSNKHRECYCINYFHYLNKIFSNSKISILTGKVVGDPPVSPAVMAGTFLEDLIYFVKQLSMLQAGQACEFHNDVKNNSNDASYHDMAELFGFKPSSDHYDYHCSLENTHNHIDCFNHFSGKLKHFFDGEHPTRKSYYQHEDVINSIKSARTIYTGNYIFKPENLKYFIPFANLKLRMAGPVLGRIIKAELGDHFVSANLPMLHKRTVNTIGQSEFRPGVTRQNNQIDLSGEFTRQYFGDVMLFTMIELTDKGYPQTNVSYEVLSDTIHKTIVSMKKKYTIKHREISVKIDSLRELLNNLEKKWHNTSEFDSNNQTSAFSDFNHFIDNIDFNFGKNARIYEIIKSEDTKNKHLKQIANAIMSYNDDVSLWQKILSEIKH